MSLNVKIVDLDIKSIASLKMSLTLFVTKLTLSQIRIKSLVNVESATPNKEETTIVWENYLNVAILIANMQPILFALSE